MNPDIQRIEVGGVVKMCKKDCRNCDKMDCDIREEAFQTTVPLPLCPQTPPIEIGEDITEKVMNGTYVEDCPLPNHTKLRIELVDGTNGTCQVRNYRITQGGVIICEIKDNENGRVVRTVLANAIRDFNNKVAEVAQ